MELKQPPRSRRELLELIEHDRAWFDAIIARVPPERLDEPSLPGGWSVKNVLWHIAWGRREAIGAAKARALVGSKLWDLPQDERNAVQLNQSRPLSVDHVLSDYGDSHRTLIAELEGMTDDELNDPARMVGLSGSVPGWRPWRVLYDPGHYLDHGQTIEDWLRHRESRRRSG